MAKKNDVKKVRPSEAVRSLELYNEKVLMLVQTCNTALQNDLVDKIISPDMKNAMNEVKEFYETE